MRECRNSQVAQVDSRGDREHRTPNIPRSDELCYDNTKHRWVPRFQNVRPKYCAVTMATPRSHLTQGLVSFWWEVSLYIWGLSCDGREIKRGLIYRATVAARFYPPAGPPRLARPRRRGAAGRWRRRRRRRRGAAASSRTCWRGSGRR